MLYLLKYWEKNTIIFLKRINHDIITINIDCIIVYNFYYYCKVKHIYSFKLKNIDNFNTISEY